MTDFAILASGRGSNFDSIANAIDERRLIGKICCVVSDRPDALVLKKAAERGIPVEVVKPESKESRESHDARVLDRLVKYAPRFIVLAGYTRILSEKFISAFDSGLGYSRITNIHPSLLPEFKGLHGYRKAFEEKRKQTGVTVHLVDPQLDNGPICAQEAFDISDCTSAEEVEARGLKVEHRLYPQTLNWVLKEAFDYKKGSTHVRPS